MRKKPVKQKGKLSFSRYFQELNPGDFVSVIKELSVPSTFPKRLQGRTGVVEGKRGRTYVVNIKDQEKSKKFLIEAIHLKKIKAMEKA
ncbi:MAG: 50S ribosomal protein L21e [Nanoarchaeota archaeon]